MPFYAHSLDGEPKSQWETMSEHEARVAERCSEFLARIHPELEAWGDLLGRWHDLGKYSDEFQAYISNANISIDDDVHEGELQGRVDHSTAAAQWVAQRCQGVGRLFSYVFAGHHAGLADWDNGESHSGLRHRLKKAVCDWSENAPKDLVDLPIPVFPRLADFGSHRPLDPYQAAFRVQFLCRMIFSCLVDGDFLATERFMSKERAEQRPLNEFPISAIVVAVGDYLDELSAGRTSSVDLIRREVRDHCRLAAQAAPGFFSFNVPTGGGKTLSSLEFATRHAELHNLDRVIVAVPFTSIIEQNVDVYRDVFRRLSDEIVIEHHSNLDPDNETTVNRLQAENWDAPIVVTTNVQLFESLFATRTSRCRKLHRVARSVIVLDEAQTLPVELLQPTLMALKELVEVYGCTVVLCTATQPALNRREGFRIGLEGVRPIVPNAMDLHDRLRRTKVIVRGVIPMEQLGDELMRSEQVLCVVNTRAEAAELYELLDDSDGNFHLSTRMCGEHRSRMINVIRRRLALGMSCRVVSTQLIEAGVDVDFPVVFRAICGLDSLAQAAGRCNREGRLERGIVYLFETERPPPAGFLRQTADTTRELIPDFVDLISPMTTDRYFEQLYWRKSDAWDRHQVLEAFGHNPNKMQFNFREAGQRYRFIRDITEPVLVPWVGKDGAARGEELCNQLDRGYGLNLSFWRKAQRYTINVRQHERIRLCVADAIVKSNEHWVLVQKHLYDEELGLRLPIADGVLPSDDLII